MLVHECWLRLILLLITSQFAGTIFVLFFESCEWSFCLLSYWISSLGMRLNIVEGSSKRAVHRCNVFLGQNCLREVFKNTFVFIPKHHLYFTESLLLFNFIYRFISSKSLIISVFNFRMCDFCYFWLNVRFCDFWNVDCFKLVDRRLFALVILWHKKQIRFAIKILTHFKEFCRLMNRWISVTIVIFPPFFVWSGIRILGQLFSMNTKRNVSKLLHVLLDHNDLSFFCQLSLSFLLFMLVRLP